MSNNNTYWGKKYGFMHKDGSMALVVRQFSSGSSNSGKSNNVPLSFKAKLDKAIYQEMVKARGRIVISYEHGGFKGRRIA